MIINKSENLYPDGGKSYRGGMQNYMGVAPSSNMTTSYNRGRAISLSILSMFHSSKI